MIIYQTISQNLDVNENAVRLYFYLNKDKAIESLSDYVKNVSGKNQVQDTEGHRLVYECKSLDSFCAALGKPAIYYRSRFGNYRCVVFVIEIYVIE